MFHAHPETPALPAVLIVGLVIQQVVPIARMWRYVAHLVDQEEEVEEEVKNISTCHPAITYISLCTKITVVCVCERERERESEREWEVTGCHSTVT